MSFSWIYELTRKWNRREEEMIERHKNELVDYQNQLEKESRAARDANKKRCDELEKNTVSAESKGYFASMLQTNLSNELQRIEAADKERVALAKEAQGREVARHRLGYEEALKLRLEPRVTQPEGYPSNNELVSEAVHRSSNSISASPKYQPPVPVPVPAPATTPESFTKLFTCNINWEVIGGKKRLMLRYQGNKRKAPKPEPGPGPNSKRLRIDTAVNPLQTPADTPSVLESDQQPARTITFNEVYQEGHAKHKDTIVEWPVGSRKWYILKCEKHNFHFKERPVQGAAKHLEGRGHGFAGRNRDRAVKTIGYRVTDCNKDLVAINNSAATKAYADGYRPNTRERRRRQVRTEVKNNTVQVQPPDIITHPKPFHIYYCHWRPENRAYPALILGWDDLAPAKLGDLQSTGLLDRESSPPPCYVYRSNKIVGWSAGYGDGQSKAKSRKFPVMFFDDMRRVGWASARSLSKFPLNMKTPPKKASDPYNQARQWIAEKEGFTTWEEREATQARHGTEETTVGLKTPTVSPLSPVDKSKWRPLPCNQGNKAAADHPHPPNHEGDEEDESREDSGTDHDAESGDSNAAERVELERLLEKVVDKSDDGDYIESDVDSSLEEEVNESGRPWAFYDFRKGEVAKSSLPETFTPQELDQVNRKVAAEECSPGGDTDSTTELSASLGGYHSTESPLVGSEMAYPNESQSGRTTSCEPCIRVGQGGSRPHSIIIPNSSGQVLETAGDSCTAPSAVVGLDVMPLSTPADFELSGYSNGLVRWSIVDETTPCLKLYRSADGMKMDIRGTVEGEIDPLAFVGYVREITPDEKNNVIRLVSKDDSDGNSTVVRLVFGRSQGSTVNVGKIQSWGFPRWLKRVNREIQFLGSEG